MKSAMLVRYARTLLVPMACAASAWLFSSCASTSARMGRVFLDSSTHSDDPPDWARDTKLVWERDGKIILRGSHTVRGDERVNGCYDLVKLDVKETILTEIATTLKGSLDNAQQSMSENAEVVLGKVRSGEYDGQLVGLRFTEEYFERYAVSGVERVDCHILGEIKQADYDRVKRAVVDKVVAVDPRLKEAITQKQVDFFDKSKGPAQ
jgi:hypothetical protein